MAILIQIAATYCVVFFAIPMLKYFKSLKWIPHNFPQIGFLLKSGESLLLLLQKILALLFRKFPGKYIRMHVKRGGVVAGNEISSYHSAILSVESLPVSGPKLICCCCFDDFTPNPFSA